MEIEIGSRRSRYGDYATDCAPGWTCMDCFLGVLVFFFFVLAATFFEIDETVVFGVAASVAVGTANETAVATAIALASIFMS